MVSNQVVLLVLFCLAANAGKFFIYDWPTHLNDVYPPKDATLHHESGYSHQFRGNDGIGDAIDPSIGMFQTWQFSLYRNLISRLRTSDKRTRTPSKASAFIIPFDLGVHSYIDHENGRPRLGSPHGWLVGQLLRQASSNETFWSKNGHDHFVIFGITSYQMVGIGVKNFLMEVCNNCTVITIETTPTFTATPYYSNRHRKWWFAVPYPSAFHWWTNIETLPWSMSPSRHYLVSFIGSVDTKNPNSNVLRHMLRAQCQEANASNVCTWHQASHACNGVVNASEVMKSLRQTVFCPAPPGDSITRKSLFDSILGGCIPVIFIRASLTQYKWHLSHAEVEAISVYIPFHNITEGGINFLNVLRNISREDIAEKQIAIAKIAPRLQYSLVPHLVVSAGEEKTWSPPFTDAADIVIDKIVDSSTIEPLDGFSKEQLIQKRSQQREAYASDEDYAGLKPGLHKRMKRKSGN